MFAVSPALAQAPADAAGGATSSAATGTVDLAAITGFGTRFAHEPLGPGPTTPVYNNVKRSAALLGDVNGDGIGDLAIGDPNADPRGRTDAGSVYVLFGQHGAAPDVNLAALGDRGYRIDGRTAHGRLGSSIAALDAADGKGPADFAIGAPWAAVRGRGRSGAVYVVHGAKGQPRNIDLLDKEPGITRLLGSAAADRTGWAVAALRGADGGPPGLVIGAPGADANGRAEAGTVYVLPGPLPSTGNHLLDALPAKSYRVDGAHPGDNAGYAVGSSADMNGDGLGEVLVGAPFSGPDSAGGFAGEAYVVTSRPIGASVDLGALMAQGIELQGQAGSRLGWSILGIGDLSGDGVPDVAVGAPTASPGGRARAGSVFVVPGRASSPLPIVLPSTPDVAIAIDGERRFDRFGRGLALAGDLDRDAVPDLLVSAPNADPLGRPQAGAVYVLRGSRIRAGGLDIGLLASSGVRLAGPGATQLGGSVLAGGRGAGGGPRDDVVVGGVTSSVLLDLPEIADADAIATTTTSAGCKASRDFELVVDDTQSMKTSDPHLLRRQAIEQMLSKPRDQESRIGAIEIGAVARQVFPPLTIPAIGLTEGPEIEGVRGLLDEHIANDAGATNYAAGLLAGVRHNRGADALVLITDATEPPPPARLRPPGPRVYVLELSGPYRKKSQAALTALAQASGGRYFEAVDDVSLPAALAIVEADLSCEQTLFTEVVTPAGPTPAAPAAKAPSDTGVAIATTKATAKPAFVTGLGTTTNAATITLNYFQRAGKRRTRRAKRARTSCINAAPLSLRSVRVSRTGGASVRATVHQLRRALSGHRTRLGDPHGVGLLAIGRCGRGFLTLRIAGIQRVAGPGAGVLAARESQARVNYSARFKRGRKPRPVGAAGIGHRKRRNRTR